MTKKPGKLPKKIAGVKVPKGVRKAGGKLLEQANTPRGREVIATGLAMVAAAASARAKPRHTPGDGEGGETKPAGKPVLDAGYVADAFSAAAGAFMNGLMGRKA